MKELGNNKEDQIDLEFRSVRSLFETNGISRMYEISKLYPTKVVKALGLNYGRYIKKLANPGDFSINEILKFSSLIGVNPNKVIEVILREANPSRKFTPSKKPLSKRKKS